MIEINKTAIDPNSGLTVAEDTTMLTSARHWETGK